MTGLLESIKSTTPGTARAALDASLSKTPVALGSYMGEGMARSVMAALTGATSYSLFTTLAAMSRIGPPDPDSAAAVIEALVEGMRSSWLDWLHQSHQMPEEAFLLLDDHIDVVTATVYHTLQEGIAILRTRAAPEPTPTPDPQDTIH